MRWRVYLLLTGCWLAVAEAAPAASSAVDEAALDSTVTPSPRSVLWRSVLLPGWGQLAIGRPVKAVLFAGAGAGWLSSAVTEASRVDRAVTTAQRQDRAARRNTRILYYVLTATLAGLDAYVDAHLDDFDLQPEPAADAGARLSLRF